MPHFEIGTIDFIEMWFFFSNRFFHAVGLCRCRKGIRCRKICNVDDFFSPFILHSLVMRARTFFFLLCLNVSCGANIQTIWLLSCALPTEDLLYIHDVQKKHLSVEKRRRKKKCSPNGSHCDKLRTLLFFFTFFSIPKKFTGNVCNYRPNAPMSLISRN